MQSGCNAARNASKSCLLDQVWFGWTAHNRKSAGQTVFTPKGWTGCKWKWKWNEIYQMFLLQPHVLLNWLHIELNWSRLCQLSPLCCCHLLVIWCYYNETAPFKVYACACCSRWQFQIFKGVFQMTHKRLIKVKCYCFILYLLLWLCCERFGL